MEEEIIKPEKTESPKSTDRVSQTETISSSEQNKNYEQAQESNPDQFPSIANLRIPNADQIEPFQIIDDGKTIAASRRIEPVKQTEPAGNPSFHEGLKALPEGATLEQLAQYQTDYILRKTASTEAAGTMQALNPTILLEGRVEKTQTTQETNEYYERMAGFLIGSVQGIGLVAVGLADIADFAAYVILEDKRAGLKIEHFCQALSNTITAGGQLFNSAYDYLYDIGFEGDYSKPFSDIASLAIILNDRWNQLPAREQERRKAEFISQLIADGLVGMAGAQSLGKAKNFTQLLDDLAASGIDKAGKSSKKLAESIGKHVDDLLQPELEVAGVGKMKMKDIPRVTKDDLALKMEEQRPRKAYRGDDNFKSKFDEKGRPKSHINEQGDLVPANSEGIFNGKPVDAVDHVLGFLFSDAKSYSPYISLSLKEGVAVRFGNEKLTVNIEALRKAVSLGELPSTEIIEHADLLEIIKHSQKTDHQKTIALYTIKLEQEMLVKGTIPRRYLEISK